MRLTMLGGGGFRTPLVYEALQRDAHERRLAEVVLYDSDPARLYAMRHILQQLRNSGGGPTIRATSDLTRAVDGADFVFSALRVGGLAGRVADERVALDLGLLGQETTGAGGVAYGLRTVPVALEIARTIAAHAPGAWVINFTNPAGMVTEAMQAVLGDRVVGICDSPLGLARRVCGALGMPLDVGSLDYAGLNHLGWLREVRDAGGGAMAELMNEPARLESFEERRLFGAEWLQALGAVPNEYLYYYYFTRDAVAAIREAPATRGELLVGQQADFYRDVAARPDAALSTWRETRAARDETYMAESRDEHAQRDEEDVAGGGYEGVALAVMSALARDETTSLILNVRNGSALPQLPADAVVEVPCRVDAAGARPLPVSPLAGHMSGLVEQVKEVERLTIRAAVERSPRLARQAFALHPLVDSVTVADQLLTTYRLRIPSLDEVFALRP